MQQSPVLGGDQQNQPINQPQQLLEVVLGRQGLVIERLSQHGVGRVRQEAIAQLPQRLGDASPQVGQCPLAHLLRLAAPLLQDRRLLGALRAHSGAKARSVGQQPQGDKVGVALLLEDASQVSLDIGGPGQAGVIAQDPDGVAIGDDAPLGGMAGVEIFLQRGMRGAAPAFRRITEVALVQVGTVRGQQDRGVAQLVSQRETAFIDGFAGHGLHLLKTQHAGKERQQPEIERELVRPGVRARRAHLVVRPQGRGDAPKAADLVLDVEPRRDIVIRSRLVPGLEFQQILQKLRRQQAAFDVEGVGG